MATFPFCKLKSVTLFSFTLPLSTHLDPHCHHTSSATFLFSHLPSSLPSAIQSSSNILNTTAYSKKNSTLGLNSIPYCLYTYIPSFTPFLNLYKNAFLPAFYHLIALLCTDYKIFTMILSSHMKSFLPDLFLEH